MDAKTAAAVFAASAAWARGAHQTRSRLARTEKVWFFRAYQASEPFSIIDWRQSGRSDTLLVREHEPLHKKPLYLWTSPDASNALAVTLLLALGRLALAQDRQAGWLDGNSPPVCSAVLLEKTHDRLQEEHLATALQDPRPPQPGACLVLAAPFAANESLWIERMDSWAGQGGKGILIDLSPSPDALSCLKTRARNLDWPFFCAPPDINALQNLLPLLLEQALRLTL